MNFEVLVRQAGPPALFILTLLETIGIPVPSEFTLLTAGAAASRGYLSLPLSMLFAVLGCLVGSSISYRIGMVAGTRWLYGLGKRLGIKPEGIARTEAWFKQKGHVAVLIGRFLPFVRALVGYPAGMTRMPFGLYIGYTLAGYSTWAIASLYVGYLGGKVFTQDRLSRYVYLLDEVLWVAAALALGYVLWRVFRRAGTQRAPGNE